MNANCTRGVKALGAMAIAGLLTAGTLAADKEAGKPSSPQSPAAGTQKNLNSPTPSQGGQPAPAAPAGQINQGASDTAAKAPPVATPPRPQSNPAPAATSDKPQANDARPVDGQPRGEKQADAVQDQSAKPDRDRRDADRDDPSRASAPKPDNADAKRSNNEVRRQPSGAVQHQTNRAYSNTPSGARPGTLNNNGQSRATGYNTANIGLALGAGNRGLYISSIGSLSFNLTFDSSTNGAPAGFFTAFDDAIQFYESSFSDPVTINLQVGWGKINGQNLVSGALGQSATNGPGFFSFSQVKSALISDAKSAADASAVANLPAVDPYGGTELFTMSNAEAKALGLLAANAPGVDGWVGFSSATSWTFDPNNRAIAGTVDFIGIAGHEITEVMGRFGLGQNGANSGRYSPIDLFRYSSPGVLDLVPASGAYFSINGGNAAINTFNGPGGGDLSDWSGATVDSYNAFGVAGAKMATSAGDITLMDVIGYNAVLEPSKSRADRRGAFAVCRLAPLSTTLRK